MADPAVARGRTLYGAALLAVLGLMVLVAALDARTGGWRTVNWPLLVILFVAGQAVALVQARRGRARARG